VLKVVGRWYVINQQKDAAGLPRSTVPCCINAIAGNTVR
jgi:hypothetical protein